MNKQIRLIQGSLTALILLSFAMLNYGFRAENSVVALVTKVIEDVTKKTQSTEWNKATKGDILNTGDAVRTGSKSLAIIKFTTDNSILRVRELSLVKLNGDGSSKNVELQNGGFGFEIQKQKENAQFKFTSPTSVASIRGTRGKMSSGESGDTLIVTEGLVNLKNTISNKDIDVGAGSVGVSTPDGSISSRKATPQEMADANSAVGNNENKLNIELKDSKGNKKELKIEYKK